MDWIIVTGAYVDDIEEKIIIMKENAQEKIDEVIWSIVLISAVIILLITILITFILNKLIIKTNKYFNDGIRSLIKDTTNTNMTIKKKRMMNWVI